MRKLFLALMLGLLLSGCADMNISNPFSSTPSNPGDFYFEQFPDIPIPRDMDVDRSRTLVSVSADGTKMGLLTAEGRVEILSLATAMIHNMVNQGWTLRAVVNGPKSVQLYEKDNRYAILYFYDQTTKAAMEIWVATRLPDGMIPTLSGSGQSGQAGGASSGMGSGGYMPPASSGSGGGATPLSQ